MSTEECSSVDSVDSVDSGDSIDIEPSVAERILEFEKLIRIHSGLPFDASGAPDVLAYSPLAVSICQNWLFRRAQLASGRKWIGSRVSLLSSTSGYTSDYVTTPPPVPLLLEAGLLSTDEELDEEIHWSDFETPDDADDIDDVNDVNDALDFATSLRYCSADSEVYLIDTNAPLSGLISSTLFQLTFKLVCKYSKKLTATDGSS